MEEKKEMKVLHTRIVQEDFEHRFVILDMWIDTMKDNGKGGTIIVETNGKWWRPEWGRAEVRHFSIKDLEKVLDDETWQEVFRVAHKAAREKVDELRR